LRHALQSSDQPQYVFLLNADTLVRPRALKALVQFMDEHRKVGIAGSAQEYPDGTPHHSAFRFHTPLSEFEGNLKLGLVSRLLKGWVVALPNVNRACKVDWVSGASMIVRREVFNDIGLLDEGYYTHFEDVDFCFNAGKAGWMVWSVPSSLIMHLAGQSTGLTVRNPKRRPAYFFEARRRYFLKNHNPAYAAMADAGLIVGLALWRLRVVLTGKEDPNPPFLLRDSIRHSVFLTGFKVREVQNPAQVRPSAQT
jgi:N-acetylglucosaminyl-diphospho-decaprenol L-rhamnosyltransferase